MARNLGPCPFARYVGSQAHDFQRTVNYACGFHYGARRSEPARAPRWPADGNRSRYSSQITQVDALGTTPGFDYPILESPSTVPCPRRVRDALCLSGALRLRSPCRSISVQSRNASPADSPASLKKSGSLSLRETTLVISLSSCGLTRRSCPWRTPCSSIPLTPATRLA